MEANTETPTEVEIDSVEKGVAHPCPYCGQQMTLQPSERMAIDSLGVEYYVCESDDCGCQARIPVYADKYRSLEAYLNQGQQAKAAHEERFRREIEEYFSSQHPAV